jgi:hypothetical protein
MLRPAHAKIVAAHVAIEVVVKSTLLTIFEQDAHQAGAPDKDRRHLFNHNSTPPLSVIGVEHFIPEPEIEALLLVHIRS